MKPLFFATPERVPGVARGAPRTASELLVGFHKKATRKAEHELAESVEQALCFGWIDGVRRGLDDDGYTIRFTPRKPRSTWSAVNVAKVEELKRRGLMRPAGLRAFEARTPERTGIYSFERREAAVLPPEYEERLRAERRRPGVVRRPSRRATGAPPPTG